MFKNKNGAIIAIITLLIFSVLVSAQDRFGRQPGTVTDPDGNPIEGVTVTADKYSVKTDKDGKFIFLRLPARTFKFVFTKEGYVTTEGRKQVAAIMNNRPLNITMQPAQPQPKAQTDTSLDLNAIFQEGAQLTQQGKFKEALEKFNVIMEANPDIWQAQLYAGMCYYFMGKYQEAIDNLQPNLEKINQPQFIAFVADAYMFLRKYEDAILYFEKLMELDAADAKSYVNLGVCYTNINMHGDAVEAFKLAVSKDPAMAEAYLRMGFAHNKLEQRGEALAAFIKAIEVEPSNKEAHLAAAESYNYQEKFMEAADMYEKYLALDSTSSLARQARNQYIKALLKHATLLILADKHDEARPFLEKVISTAPESDEAKDATELLKEVEEN